MDLDPVMLKALELMLPDVYAATKRGATRVTALLRRADIDQSLPPEERARALTERAAQDEGVRAAVEAFAERARQRFAVEGVPEFWCDRESELAAVPTSGMCVLYGLDGSGKASLARRVARDHDWPDGIALVDLARHYTSGGLDIRAAKQEVLRQLDVHEVAVEDNLTDEQYINELRTARALVTFIGLRSLNDLARFEVPHSTALTLVTTGTVDPHTKVHYSCIQLGRMAAKGARRLLAGRGDQSIEDLLSREPDATDELLDMCGFLPEPIMFCTLSLQHRRDHESPVRGLVERVRERGLSSVRSLLPVVVDDCMRRFPANVQRALRVLAESCPAGFDIPIIAAVLDCAPNDAEELWDELHDTHLIVREHSGRARLEPAVHDWCRAHPAEAVDGRGQPSSRLWKFVLACGEHGDYEDEQNRLRPFSDGPSTTRPIAGRDLIGYVDARWDIVLDAAGRAHDLGRHEEVCRLGIALEVWVNKRGRYREYLSLSDIVIRSAMQLRASGAVSVELATAALSRARAIRGRVQYLTHDVEAARENLRVAQELLDSVDPEKLGDNLHKRLTASLLQFRARLHEIEADILSSREKNPDIDTMRRPEEVTALLRTAARLLDEAIRLDREAEDERALHIDLRTRANVSVKLMLAVPHLEYGAEAMKYLDEAAGLPAAHGRNLARVHMVRCKVLTHLNLHDEAAHDLTVARTLIDENRATSYEWELDELTARLAEATGDTEAAHRIWQGLYESAWQESHPVMKRYRAWQEKLTS